MVTESEPVGSLADEAAKLFRAVADSSADEHTCTTAWCPVCRVAGYVRENPEILDEVTQLGVELVRTIREALEAALTTPRSTP